METFDFPCGTTACARVMDISRLAGVERVADIVDTDPGPDQFDALEGAVDIGSTRGFWRIDAHRDIGVANPLPRLVIPCLVGWSPTDLQVSDCVALLWSEIKEIRGVVLTGLASFDWTGQISKSDEAVCELDAQFTHAFKPEPARYNPLRVQTGADA